jgi:hypothetical protein
MQLGEEAKIENLQQDHECLIEWFDYRWNLSSMMIINPHPTCIMCCLKRMHMLVNLGLSYKKNDNVIMN